ncbi:MAG: hypothetical protein IPL52_11595 [Flavobacteriales bacterium]|nr:hypothetical protein [Flavobacteriales bacterium]
MERMRDKRFVAPELHSATAGESQDRYGRGEGEVIVLATGLVGPDHVWQDGSTGSAFGATASGTLWVEAGPPGCTSSDTVAVTFNPLPLLDLGPDTSFCIDRYWCLVR